MGLFKKSPPKEISVEDLEIEISSGWTVIDGPPFYLALEGERARQKTLNRIYEVAVGKNVPVRFKYDPYEKESVSVHTQLGVIGELRDYQAKPWLKRISAAADEKKIYVGEARLTKGSKDGVITGYLLINKENEISIDLSKIEAKKLSDAQIEKELQNLEKIAGLYPETNSQVKSQAKKAVRVIANLYSHAMCLEDQTNSLVSLCSEFILESEKFADSDDDMENEIDSFLESWKECIAGTGQYAPKVPSAFETADADRIQKSPELKTMLAGKSIVITGDFQEFTREEAEMAIKNRGGKSPGSISKKTYALVVGALPGEVKLATANELNIPLVDVNTFLRILETGLID
jgi:hypothetical protein